MNKLLTSTFENIDAGMAGRSGACTPRTKRSREQALLSRGGSPYFLL